jgi:hypothetical protein
MSDLRELIVREASRIEPSTEGLEGTLRKVRRRERARRRITAGIALAVAVTGTLVAVRAFSRAPLEPGTAAGSNYEIEARLATPDDVSGQPARGPDFQWVHGEVRWDPDRYPGVRRCTWQVLDEANAVIGERVEVYAPLHGDETGRAETNAKVHPIDGEPKSARGFCDQERLDVPGITGVDPIPTSVRGWGRILDLLDDRLARWSETYAIDRMTVDELAGNLWALWRDLRDPPRGVPTGERDFLVLRERGQRMGALCTRLPLGHEYRNEEFCDSGAPVRPGESPEPPVDRFVAGQGEAGGTAWEIFAIATEEGPALGFDIDPGEWGFSTRHDPDPCGIESGRIYWLHLREDPSSVVVLQFAAVTREASSVRFELADGRSVPAQILEIPEQIAPWNAFAATFEGPRDIVVSEIVVRDADGRRLDDPGSC